jgi:hypothetical protein
MKSLTLGKVPGDAAGLYDYLCALPEMIAGAADEAACLRQERTLRHPVKYVGITRRVRSLDRLAWDGRELLARTLRPLRSLPGT